MTRTPGQQRLDGTMTEASFQDALIALAQWRGWTVNHVRKGTAGRTGGWLTATSVVGWPDLTFLRPPELFFAELKSERGAVSKEQKRVLALLEACGQEVHVWRPRHFEEAARRLE